MNIQTARELLAEELTRLAPDGWFVSTDTLPIPFSGMIHVGHALEVIPGTFNSYDVDLAITLWVNEGTDTESAAKLYRLLSPDPGGILRAMPTSQFGFTAMTVTNIGARFVEGQGPTMYLTADITIRIQVFPDET